MEQTSFRDSLCDGLYPRRLVLAPADPARHSPRVERDDAKRNAIVIVDEVHCQYISHGNKGDRDGEALVQPLSVAPAVSLLEEGLLCVVKKWGSLVDFHLCHVVIRVSSSMSDFTIVVAIFVFHDIR